MATIVKRLVKRSPRLTSAGQRTIALIYRGLNFRTISKCLQSAASPKLHIGCGRTVIPGWLNGDLVSYKNIPHMNATKQLPLPSLTFEYIFTGHMIEHISYQQGKALLRECYRVLKPGGTIRGATPDFKFLANLYADPFSDVNARYIARAGTTHGKNPPTALVRRIA